MRKFAIPANIKTYLYFDFVLYNRSQKKWHVTHRPISNRTLDAMIDMRITSFGRMINDYLNVRMVPFAF